jgi:sodium/bile acid cotransporter 7
MNMSWLRRIPIDKFLLSILLTVLFASLFPCTGEIKAIFKHLTTAAIALLFFMHGAKLSRSALINGLGHWRLHIAVFSSTFVLFPLLGVGMQFLEPTVLSPEIYLGFLFLCAMPGTVQAAIAFTSVAGGNVPAAICSSSASSILGVFLSPLLVGLLMHTQGVAGHTLQAIYSIILQLMVPFIIGHLMRPLIGNWMDKNKKLVGKVDRSSILLVVYTAFSEAVVEGIWHKVNGVSLIAIITCSALLLSVVIAINIFVAKRLKFSTPDEITLVFCGSKKSLVNGIPIANVLFPAASVGLMVLPLMVFHQLQLIVCAIMAQRYARLTANNHDD